MTEHVVETPDAVSRVESISKPIAVRAVMTANALVEEPDDDEQRRLTWIKLDGPPRIHSGGQAARVR